MKVSAYLGKTALPLLHMLRQLRWLVPFEHKAQRVCLPSAPWLSSADRHHTTQLCPSRTLLLFGALALCALVLNHGP